jgi:hypothetical protein
LVDIFNIWAEKKKLDSRKTGLGVAGDAGVLEQRLSFASERI